MYWERRIKTMKLRILPKFKLLLILGLLLEPRQPPPSQLVFLLIVTTPFVLILGRVHFLDDFRHVRLRLGS